MLALWLLLVGTVAVDELITGAAAAALAASLAVAVHRRGYIEFQPRARWLTELPRLCLGIATDTGRLAVALWQAAVLRRPVRGSMIAVPFHHGGDNGRDGARRALVNLAVSITPNSYVVDIDPDADRLLVHQLVAVPLDRVLQREQQRAEGPS